MTEVTEPALSMEFLFTAFGSITVFLLGIIAFFLKQTIDSFNARFTKLEERQDKHSKINDEQNQEISELKSFTHHLTEISKDTTENMKLIRADLANFNSSLIETVVQLAKR